jgi:fatty-acyl-CoA synthase
LVINTGGEKVFVEEVETTIRRHPQVVNAKLPRAVVIVNEVVRHASGKPDYTWARKVAAEATAITEAPR